ncbi:MAG: response regulator [Candidatus Sericytochromatia bacterium]|nr:response regulator [Candidatus Sericytochromatia bacterium]
MNIFWVGESNHPIFKLLKPQQISLTEWPKQGTFLVNLDQTENITWLARYRAVEESRLPVVLLSHQGPLQLSLYPWLRFEAHEPISPIKKSEINNKISQSEILSLENSQNICSMIRSNEWIKLNHDAAKTLQDWPSNHELFALALKRYLNWIGPTQDKLAKKIQSLLLEAKDLPVASVREKLTGLNPNPENEQKYETETPELNFKHLENLLLHWQALKHKVTDFKLKISPEEQKLLPSDFLKRLDSLSSAEELQALAKQTESITQMQGWSDRPLAALFHNTLSQHLGYLAASLPMIELALKINNLDLPRLEAEVNQRKTSEQIVAKKQHTSLNYPQKFKHEKIHVLVVENEPTWQATVWNLLEEICEKHPKLNEQIVFGPALACASLSEAIAPALLKSLEKVPLLLVTDLSIPAQPGEDPKRQNGVALLEQVTKTSGALPLIVLSVPGHSYQDHLQITQLGIHDADYVAKNSTRHLRHRLEEWCLLLYHQAHRPHVIRLNPEKEIFSIDGLEIDLSPIQILVLKALVKGNVDGMSLKLPSEWYAERENYKVLHENRDLSTAVSKHLSTIKKKIAQKFNQNGRNIGPNEIIQSRKINAEKKNAIGIAPGNLCFYDDSPYAAEFTETDFEADDNDFIGDLSPLKWPEPRVLVIEDEPLWQKQISELLENMGLAFRVVSSLESLSDCLEEFIPDILSLDMMIPLKDGSEPLPNGGFLALEQVRAKNPIVQTVIPSTLFDRGLILSQAAQMKVPVTDFIPKGVNTENESWLMKLYAHIRKFRMQLMNDWITDPLSANAKLLPILNVSILSYDNENSRLTLRVNGNEYKYKGNQARIFSALILRAGQHVLVVDMITLLQDIEHDGNRNEAFEQALSDARKSVVQDWLGHRFSQEYGPKILERRFQWLCLHINPVEQRAVDLSLIEG